MPTEQINGTTIFYEVTGDGEPLVLVHGAWVDHHSWDQVVPALAKSYRVVTYDLRGHGQSVLDPPHAGSVHDDVADLAALVERLELGDANVAGISSGASIALRLAVEHPLLVRRTLAHEPPCMDLLADVPEAKPMLDEVVESMDAVADLLERGDHREAAERFVDEVAIGPGAWAELPAEVQDAFTEHGPTFLGQLHDPDNLRVDFTGLPGIATPVLLTQGDSSPPMFAPIMELLAELMPCAERRRFVDAGHVPHMTHPAAYVAVVTEFLAPRGIADDLKLG